MGGLIAMVNKAGKNIVIYSTPNCPICKRAKTYLTKRGIVYKDIDVSVNEETAHEMIHRSGQMGTPVIFVGEQMMLGFNQKKMDDMLAK
jgi:glutaredoxin-like YruB-family protein